MLTSRSREPGTRPATLDRRGSDVLQLRRTVAVNPFADSAGPTRTEQRLSTRRALLGQAKDRAHSAGAAGVAAIEFGERASTRSGTAAEISLCGVFVRDITQPAGTLRPFNTTLSLRSVDALHDTGWTPIDVVVASAAVTAQPTESREDVLIRGRRSVTGALETQAEQLGADAIVLTAAPFEVTWAPGQEHAQVCGAADAIGQWSAVLSRQSRPILVDAAK